jgi:hypothetical protein
VILKMLDCIVEFKRSIAVERINEGSGLAVRRPCQEYGPPRAVISGPYSEAQVSLPLLKR